MMNRRGFLSTMSLLLATPLAAEAQPAGKVWRIGFLHAGSKSDAAPVLQPFLEGLRQLGYVEGKTLTVVIWAAEGHPEDLPALAAQLVQAKPDVIVTQNAGHAMIVQKLTRTLPIVVLGAGEIVSFGLVASLAKPGGNLTGMQLFSPELMGKRLQILQKVVPNLRRIAVLRAPIRWTPQFFARYRQATDEPAAQLGIRARYVGFDDPDQLPGLFAEMAKERDDALLVWSNPELARFFARIQELTILHRLPAVHEFGWAVRPRHSNATRHPATTGSTSAAPSRSEYRSRGTGDTRPCC